MTDLNKDIKFRCFVLDALISNSGKVLLPELVGELATEIVALASEVYQSSTADSDERR